MKKYLLLIRFDHWIKQLFIVPGIVVALAVVGPAATAPELLSASAAGILSACMIASSNYVINEWLDAKTDRFHPTKKTRSAVTNSLNKTAVYALYFGLFASGMILGTVVGKSFMLTALLLWLMGVFYNVRPFRTKDIAYVDVYTESINSALRFLLGWYIVTDAFYPPISIVLGFWFSGAFLMAMKRYAERKTIGDLQTAVLYRKSFRVYTGDGLLILSFFNAMLAVLFIGVFLIKYRIELIIFMPFLIGLFSYYTHLAFKKDSAAQSPEKLYKDKPLAVFLLVLLIVFIITMTVDMPFLEKLLSDALIPVG